MSRLLFSAWKRKRAALADEQESQIGKCISQCTPIFIRGLLEKLAKLSSWYITYILVIRIHSSLTAHFNHFPMQAITRAYTVGTSYLHHTTHSTVCCLHQMATPLSQRTPRKSRRQRGLEPLEEVTPGVVRSTDTGQEH